MYMLRAWPASPHASATNPPSPPPPPSPPTSFHPAAPPVTIPTSSAAASFGSKLNSRLAMSRYVRIAVVGDVHDDWDLEEDATALHFLQADLVLFTGDFGNENVDLVRSIANLNLPKAAILGNHDCWYTSRFSRKKANRVQLQLECLGEQHVGYHRLDFPLLKLSVLGGRPFSCGGNRLFRERLLAVRYGVHDMEGSAKKIFEAALGTPEGHSLILLAHNGPTGLGAKMNDICGRDWVYGGGDHGDPDLAQAIADLKRSTQIPIPLVVFGHMHKDLAHGNGLRKMIVVGDDNTVYLNGAVVPRVKILGQQGSSSGTSLEDHEKDQDPNGPKSTASTLRAFTLVEYLDGRLQRISETWVSVHDNETAITKESVLFKRL